MLPLRIYTWKKSMCRAAFRICYLFYNEWKRHVCMDIYMRIYIHTYTYIFNICILKEYETNPKINKNAYLSGSGRRIIVSGIGWKLLFSEYAADW